MMSMYFNRGSSLLILLVNLLLQGCGGSNGSVFVDEPIVKIVYSSKENVIPAKWEFSVEADEALATIQWQFSDDGFVSHSSDQSETVDHTFNKAGINRIRLQYETMNGQLGTAESEVIIQSGSISGEIFAALNTQVDFDTRDPYEPPQYNNSFETAQPLTANSRIAGIVDSNDVNDFYQVKLQKNQTINVQVADQVNGAFEVVQLQVFTKDNTVADIFDFKTQENSGSLLASFVAPEDNSYFIKVSAFSPSVFGATQSHGIYSLHIEAALSVADFVAGELIVVMKDNREYQAQGLSSKKNLGRIKALSLTNARQFMASKHITFSADLETNTHWQTLQVAKLLADQDDILLAEPNWKRYPTALAKVTDPLFSSQWHYSAVNLESAWDALGGRGSSDVIVAVLDTGVLTTHPDLAGNLISGYDFVDDDDDANDPGDKSISGQRSSFHGTHVAGTIAAIEGDSIGGTGIAPGVKIMPVRVLGENGGTSLGIISGLCFAAQLSSSESSLCSNVPSGDTADIINLSLGGLGFSSTEQVVYNAVMNKGIIVIAAAGNEKTSEPFYPAAYDDVISVSATNQKTELASYSNFGSTIDVAAPGGDFSVDSGVLSTWGDDLQGSVQLTYGYLQGTSMASPHVAGIAALMKSIKPELTHTEFRGLLIAGDLTQDIGSTGRDDAFGYGLIDAHKSVLELMEGSGAQILSSVSRLFFDVSQTTRNFILSGTGISEDSELGNISYQILGADNGDGGSWLALDRSSGLGEYVATVNRGDMAEGTYNAQIVVSSTAANVDDIIIDVVLQVGNAELSANAGVQYVVVFQENTVANDDQKLVGVAGANALIASNGKYSYQVKGLAKGRYTISTGSDLDFDEVICDEGESCGQYPTLSKKGVLTIDEDNANLTIDMSVNYITTSIGTSAFTLEAISVPQPIEKFIGESPESLINNQADKVRQGN